MNSKSTFFKLIKKNDSKKKNIICFKGWSGLNVAKFLMPKKSAFESDEIDKKFPKLVGKEKIFIFSNDEIKFESSKKVIKINKYDALNMSTKKKFSFYTQKKIFFL